jgi:hypothetical protein
MLVAALSFSTHDTPARAHTSISISRSNSN